MAHTERVLSDHVPAPAHHVRAFYTDMNNIKTVHPLVVSVRTIAREETADGYRQTYRVSDRIPLGPFTLRTRYVAHVIVPVAGDVITEARQFLRVRVCGLVSFDAVDGGTRVRERLTICAPRVLAAITTREAVKAHTEMLAGIRRHFGG